MTSSNISNVTAAVHGTPEWNLAAAWEVVLGCLILTANVATLALLFVQRSLRTSFTAYLLLLFACNAVSALFYYPMEIIHQISHQWLMGTLACTTRIYAGNVLAAIQAHAHLTITTNRLWAIIFPISYKNHHTAKVAFYICLSMVVYVNVINLPPLVMDALYYRLDEAIYGCSFNYAAQNTWMIVAQFVVYDFPTGFICGAYPFLWYQRQKRMRKVDLHKTHQASFSLTEKVPTEVRNKRATRSFRILTMLTTSIFICWMPAKVYYTVACFVAVPFGVEYTIIDNLYNLQALMDPVMFALSLDSVRQAAGGLRKRIVIIC